jgi:tetratricopeptide (TPR) repeat protein
MPCLISYLETNQTARALKIAEERARNDVDNPDSHFRLGNVRQLLGDYPGALIAYDQVLRKDAKHVGTLGAKAFLLATAPDAKVRDGPLARKLATQACGLSRWKHPNYLLSLAAAQAECGDFDAAICTATAAIDNAGSNQSFLRQGRLFLRLFERRMPYRLSKGRSD